MSDNIVISEVPSRTYAVPAALVTSVGSRVDLDAVYSHLRSSCVNTREWAAKIANGIERDRHREEKAVLASIGYDPDRYLYWGLTASGDEDFIVAVGRVDRNDIRIENSELLSESSIWSPISSDISENLTQKGVALDAPLLAYATSAFAEGAQGVVLAYGDPHCFLDETPMLSTAITAAVGPSSNDGLVYAIVDATDTTAVMDLIMIKKGPQVYRRDGGAWVLDNSTLDALLSVSPPPIVELSGSVADDVIAQVDGSQANQLAPTETGDAEAGDMLGEEPIEVNPDKATKQTPGADTGKEAIPQKKPSDTPSKDVYASNQNKSQLKDGSTSNSAKTASLLQRYDELETVVAAARSLSSVDERAVNESKALLAANALALRGRLELREAQINNIVLPALLADAVSVYDSTPNQLKARHLRKYWIRGKGAVKIAWGTPGDFTRCVRQLRKYLGSRAEGYCAKRHKETMGFWPGDKRNTGPNKGAGKPMTASAVK